MQMDRFLKIKSPKELKSKYEAADCVYGFTDTDKWLQLMFLYIFCLDCKEGPQPQASAD